MDLELVNNVICESQLYRTTQSFKKLEGRDIANLLYINTLALIAMTQDSKQSSFAKGYAVKSGSNGPYVFFRSGATDIYALAFQVNAPDNKSTKLDQAEREFLDKLQFDNRRFSRMMLNIGNGTANPQQLGNFLISLERQLSISTSRYKTWRREIIGWGKMPEGNRANTLKMIKREMQGIAPSGELYSRLNTMLSYGSFKTVDDKPSMLKKATDAALGGAVGKALGGQLDTAIGQGSDKYSKAGKNIGAIAGYWANKRK